MAVIIVSISLTHTPKKKTVKKYPRIENVPFPGRTSAVAIVFKLTVPPGHERDLLGAFPFILDFYIDTYR